MPLLVVGSVAIDSIESPKGTAPQVLGGSATHFSVAASLFTPVRLVGVIGEDFPDGFLDVLRERDVDLSGLEVRDGKSFRWTGRYQGAMAHAETLSVELNVFGTFDPKVPEAFRASRFVFLANGSPLVQKRVLEQVDAGAYCLLDTMNLWIEIERRNLVALLKEVDALVINDEELRQLTGEANLITAGRQVLDLGPETVVVKKGEHGALLFHGSQVFAAPAFPVEEVTDPTGAGDSFAGGFMGTIASLSKPRPDFDDLKRAVATGIVTASFNVEDFGLNRLRSVTPEELNARYQAYLDMLEIPSEPAIKLALAT